VENYDRYMMQSQIKKLDTFEEIFHSFLFIKTKGKVIEN
jgi:hypothetical protein